MNILFALPWDQEVGGVTHVAASLARCLEDRGHETFFVFPAENWKIRSRTSMRGFRAIGCRFPHYDARKPSIRRRIAWFSTVVATLPQLVHFGRKHRIDLINVHYPTRDFALLADMAKRLRVPLVVSAHGSDLLPDSPVVSDKGLDRLLAQAAAVVVPSRTFLNSVLDAYPLLRNKASFIHNGYDPNEMGVDTTPEDLRRGGVVALCIATLIRKKGIDVLFRAMQLLPPGLLTVRLIGEGSLRKHLEDLAQTLGLTERIAFLGPRSRRTVFEELRNCDFLVLPSRYASESFGLAALEAMACGKPVVASAIGGLLELVDQDVTGLLVPPDDPQALSIALARICADPELRTRLGEAGRTKSGGFTVQSTAGKYESVFTRLVSEHARSSVGMSLRDEIRSRLPTSLKQPVRRTLDSIDAAIRMRALRRHVRELRRQAAEGQIAPRLIEDMCDDWGNKAFAADVSYVAEVAVRVQEGAGPFLECGSGITTVVAGIIAAHRGGKVIALEQDREWHVRMTRTLDKFAITNVDLIYAPLRRYDDYAWYDIDGIALPPAFTHIFCDGPAVYAPEWVDPILGNWRVGAVPVLQARGTRFGEIVFDDADEPRFQSMRDRWHALGVETRIVSTKTGGFGVANPVSK